MLHRLMYRSACALVGTADQVAAEIAAILAVSRRNNAAAGLTGALLHTGAAFAQVLEGPLDGLEPAYDRISADLRHTDFELLQFIPIEQRSFAGWEMALVGPADLAGVWRDDPLVAGATRAAADPLVQAMAGALRRQAPADAADQAQSRSRSSPV